MLLLDQRVVQIRRRAGRPDDPVAGAILRGERRGDRRHGLVIRQAAAGQVPLLLDFGHRCDAVIGGEDDERVVETDQFVDARQQFADGAIRPDCDVVHLRAVGAEAVADRVVRGETDAQQIRDAALAELLGLDRRQRKAQKQVVAERTAEHRVVQGSRHRREGARAPRGGIEIGPRLSGKGVGRLLRVECRRPGGQVRADSRCSSRTRPSSCRSQKAALAM